MVSQIIKPNLRSVSGGVFKGIFPSAFSPLSLFAFGEQGAWYDPSDINTLFQDSAGTTPVTAVGQPVGLIVDKSGNGLDAIQATAASRPIYGVLPKGGKRNTLFHTEDLTLGAVATGTASILDSKTVLFPNADNSRVQLFGTGISGETTTMVFSAKLSGSGTIDILIRDGGANLKQNGVSYPIRFTLSSEPTRIQFFVDEHTFSSDGVVWISRRSGATADQVTIEEVQFERGSSATNYQRVGFGYDVTEAGKQNCYYLLDDGVDDSINATLPDLGTNATAVFGNESGVSVSEGQTIGAGSYNILAGDQTFGQIVLNRQLRLSEKTNVLQYLAERTA